MEAAIDGEPTMTVVPVPTYDEVLEFLLSSPTPEEILAFDPSPEAQARVRALLDANRDPLTPQEQAELEEFSRLEHFVRMLKIKAREKLSGG